jgi:hypothetical protein
MSRRRFEDAIVNDDYQVFLMVCPATLPFSFATHPWFVVNKKGTLFRSGVSWKLKSEMRPELFKGHPCKECSGYLHKDAQPPLKGCGVLPFSYSLTWRGRMVASICGEDARRMIEIIEGAYTNYPHRNIYRLLGPNSNTYVQWVLDHFPNTALRLPWNAFGKACYYRS